MKNGYLGLPIPEQNVFPVPDTLGTKLYQQYRYFLHNSDIGKTTIHSLRSDFRVRSLEGQMISKGSGASSFSLELLTMWFLWIANMQGMEKANHYLNTFLDDDEILVLNTMWILEIEVEDTIPLTDEIFITPISQMPDSAEKEYYLTHRFDAGVHPDIKPQAAITQKVQINKSFDSNLDNVSEGFRNELLQASSKQLYESATILNLIKNTSCIPFYSTCSTLPNVPFGPFNGFGGGIPNFDVIGRKSTKVNLDQTCTITDVLSSFFALPEAEKKTI